MSTAGANLDEAVAALDELFGAIDKYRTSEGFRALLDFLARLPAVGPYNGLLLHLQRPGVTHVATVGGWQRLGRTVKCDAFPLVTLKAFGPVEFVYDIVDTVGPDLPADVTHLFRAHGQLPRGVLERTRWHAESDQIAVLESDFGSSLAGRVGGQLTDRQQVHLRTGAPAALVVELNRDLTHESQYATLVHELAHVYCGHVGVPPNSWWPNRGSLEARAREFEAEAVAWVVCSRQGLDPGSYRYLERFLRPGKYVPDASLHQIVVAANYIENLGAKRFRPRKAQTIQRSTSRRPTGSPRLLSTA